MAELNSRYNYVFFISDDFAAQMYGELADYDNVRICGNGILHGGSLLQKLHRLHWSYKLNRKLSLPLKKLWFRRMTDARFSNGKPVCYVFFGGQYCIWDYGLIEYIRKLNPENRVVIQFLDLIRHKHIADFESVKRKCDIILTYDRGEAKEYGVELFDKGVYSRLTETTHPTEFAYDLYFVGYAKDRTKRLLSLHKHLTERGVRCCFKLVGVPKEIPLQGEGLVRLENPMPYRQVVADIQKSRCILELTQQNSTGMTMRTCEAICYQRKLLSDRIGIEGQNIAQFSAFSEPSDVDISFLTSPLDYASFEDDASLSPISVVEFMEEKLLRKKDEA